MARMIIAALLLWASFPTVNAWWAAPLGIAFFAVSVRKCSLWVACVKGAAVGVMFMGAHAWWVNYLGGVPPWAGLLATQAPFFALAGAGFAMVWHVPLGSSWRASLAKCAAAASFWVAAEFLRAHFPFGGFSWGRLVFSQADSPLVWWTSVVGAPAVSWIVACVGFGLALVWDDVRTGGWAVARRGVALVGAVVVAAYGGGAAVGAVIRSEAELHDAPSMSVLAIQGGAPGIGLTYNQPYGELTERHLTVAAHAAAEVGAGDRPRPDLVVLPENALDIDPQRNDAVGTALAVLSQRTGADVLAGSIGRDSDDAPLNTVYQWNSEGYVDAYHKRVLVPFGEYIPLRFIFDQLSSLTRQVSTNFVAGSEPGMMSVGGVPVGVVTCVEESKDALVADVTARTQLLVVPSNTAQFGETAESEQQMAMSRVRAVEHRRSTVHVSTVGVSALIDPYGRVLSESGHLTQDVLQNRLPLIKTITMGYILGPWIEGTSLLVGILGLTHALVRRRAGVTRLSSRAIKEATGR